MVVAVFATLSLGAGPAHADSFDLSGTSAQCAKTVVDTEGESLVAVNRWAEATQRIHHNLDGGILGEKAIGPMVNTTTQSMMFGAGNAMYGVTAQASGWASSWCAMQQFGEVIDSVAGALGEAIISSWLVLVGIVVTVLVGIIRKVRRQGGVGMSSIVSKLLILVLLSAMVAGATASTGSGESYKAGTFSPGWFINVIDKATGAVAGIVADQIPVEPFGSKKNLDDPLSCENYLPAMRLKQQEVSDAGASTVPLLVSNLWEGSGLEAWKSAQFGRTEYADIVYCRYLDAWSPMVYWAPEDRTSEDAGTANVSQRTLVWSAVTGTGQSAKPEDFHRGMFRFSDAADQEVTDVAITAFAACKLSGGSWSIREPALLAKSSRGDTAGAAEACKNAFAEEKFLLGKMGPFNHSGKAEDLVVEDADRTASTEQAVKFLRAWQGHDTSTGVMSALVYMIGALAVLVIIGGMAVGLLVAKFSMVVMGIMLVGVLAYSLFGSSGERKALGYAKQMVGLSFFIASFSILMSLVAFIANLIGTVAGSSSLPGGPGGLLAIVITSASPVIAFFAIKSMFKKIGLPNPLSIKGGMAFANAARAMSPESLGGGAPAGYGKSRLSKLGEDTMKEARGKLAEGALGRFKSGSGGGSPFAKGSTAAAAALAAGAAGGVVSGVIGAAGDKSSEDAASGPPAPDGANQQQPVNSPAVASEPAPTGAPTSGSGDGDEETAAIDLNQSGPAATPDGATAEEAAGGAQLSGWGLSPTGGGPQSQVTPIEPPEETRFNKARAAVSGAALSAARGFRDHIAKPGVGAAKMVAKDAAFIAGVSAVTGGAGLIPAAAAVAGRRAFTGYKNLTDRAHAQKMDDYNQKVAEQTRARLEQEQAQEQIRMAEEAARVQAEQQAIKEREREELVGAVADAVNGSQSNPAARRGLDTDSQGAGPEVLGNGQQRGPSQEMSQQLSPGADQPPVPDQSGVPQRSDALEDRRQAQAAEVPTQEQHEAARDILGKGVPSESADVARESDGALAAEGDVKKSGWGD